MERILWALILFWNVENYFAPFDFSELHFGTVSQNAGTAINKSNTLDLKEIPQSGNTSEQSRKFRNWKAFSHKRDGIAKTLCLVAERYGRFPDLIGLAEVENRWVLKQLTQNTVLAMQDYGIVHKDSPDSRGIDVALLYRRSTFRPLYVRFIPITPASFNSASDTLLSQIQITHREKIAEAFLGNEATCDSTMTLKTVLKNRTNDRFKNEIHEDTLRTREILYMKGVLRGYDTLHVFVNHWPSKLGGKTAENHRCGIAKQLRWLCDSIDASVEGTGRSCIGRQIKVWHGAKIVIMGDFNAGAGDAALRILYDSDSSVRCNIGGNNAEEMFENNDAWEAGALLVDVNGGCLQTEKSGRNVTYRRKVHGSYKYKGEWSTIDRFYVSKYFVQDKEIFVESAEIFSHLYLLEQDKTYLGVKPRRSFIGPHYNGGLSDHLPVVLRFFSQLF